jgi:hypothetical protein
MVIGLPFFWVAYVCVWGVRLVHACLFALDRVSVRVC